MAMSLYLPAGNGRVERYTLTGTAPVKPPAGVKFKVVPPRTETVPCAAGTVALVTLKVSPSTSLSFASTDTPIAVSSSVVAVSLTATGASLTGVTVTATAAEDVPPFPSEIV